LVRKLIDDVPACGSKMPLGSDDLQSVRDWVASLDGRQPFR
jgi:hypothetical protein